MVGASARAALSAALLILAISAVSGGAMKPAPGLNLVCPQQGPFVPANAQVCNSPAGTPTSCPTVDAYATNAAVTSIPSPYYLPNATFLMSSVCQGVVLNFPLSASDGTVLGTSYVFKDHSDNLYVTAVLTLQDSSTGYQYYFAQPNALQTQTGQENSYSPSGTVLYWNTIPSQGLSVSNYKDTLVINGNYIGWTYKINTRSVCNPNHGSVTGSAPCNADTRDLSASSNAFLKVGFWIAQYPLASSVGQPGAMGPSCGTVDEATVINIGFSASGGGLVSLNQMPPSCAMQPSPSPSPQPPSPSPKPPSPRPPSPPRPPPSPKPPSPRPPSPPRPRPSPKPPSPRPPSPHPPPHPPPSPVKGRKLTSSDV